MDDLLGSFRGYTRGGYTYRGLVQRGAFCLDRRRNVRSAHHRDCRCLISCTLYAGVLVPALFNCLHVMTVACSFVRHGPAIAALLFEFMYHVK